MRTKEPGDSGNICHERNHAGAEYHVVDIDGERGVLFRTRSIVRREKVIELLD
jgi:hypothetical protein